MKKSNAGFLAYVTKMELQKLATIVEETTAAAFENETGKVFSNADLWNIQRNKRVFTQRRFIL